MLTAIDLLNRKGRDVHSISPDATVFDALAVMAEKNIGALMVGEEGRFVGVFSERDYARKCVLCGKFSRETTVREIMSTSPVTITPETEIRACMSLMTQHQVRHLPVLDSGKLAGVLSIGDVVKCIIEDQDDSIGFLNRYIVGR